MREGISKISKHNRRTIECSIAAKAGILLIGKKLLAGLCILDNDGLIDLDHAHRGALIELPGRGWVRGPIQTRVATHNELGQLGLRFTSMSPHELQGLCWQTAITTRLRTAGKSLLLLIKRAISARLRDLRTSDCRAPQQARKQPLPWSPFA